MKKIIKLGLYMASALLMLSLGISALSWQYWASLGILVGIDMVSFMIALEQR